MAKVFLGVRATTLNLPKTPASDLRAPATIIADAQVISLTNAVYTHTGNGEGERHLAKTGAYADYSWTSGDTIRLYNATGGLADGTYEIASKVDDDAILMAANAGLTADATGVNSYSTIPYTNMRPSVVEDLSTIANRTLVLQNAIDAASEAGGGRIEISSGLYQLNQIVMRSRVELVGAGISKTVLLHAEALPDTPFIASERLSTYKALESSSEIPQWMVHGPPVHMTIRDLTVDGNAMNYSSTQSAWDIGYTNPSLLKPNRDGNNNGIDLFGSGTLIDNVYVFGCSGTGILINRGNKILQNNYTSGDIEISRLGWVRIGNCQKDGLYIGLHPDGVLQRLEVHGCDGAGLRMDGNAWLIGCVHSFGNEYGLVNNALNYYDQLEVESNEIVGFINNGGGTHISYLILFRNGRTENTGTHNAAGGSTLIDTARGIAWEPDALIGLKVLNVTQTIEGIITDNDETTVTASMSSPWATDDEYLIYGAESVFNNGATCNIDNGRIDIMADNVTGFQVNTAGMKIKSAITISAIDAIGVKIPNGGSNYHEMDLSGNADHEDNPTILYFRGSSEGCNIKLRFNHLDHATNPGMLLKSVDGSGDDLIPYDSNRIEVRYASDSVASGVAYFGQHHTAGTSSTTMTDTNASFIAGELIGMTIKNLTDGSHGIITDNDATTVDVTLLGGTSDNWDQYDVYYIPGYSPVELIPY